MTIAARGLEIDARWYSMEICGEVYVKSALANLGLTTKRELLHYIYSSF